MRPGLRIGSLRRTLISFRAPKPHPDRFCPLSSSSQSASCSSRSLLSSFNRAALPSRRSLSSSSRVPRRPHTSRMNRTPRLRRVDPCVVSEIVAWISGGSDDLESKLRLLNRSPSHALVSETLRALNDRGVPAFRFFGWVLGSYPDFRPNSEAYNLIVLNLGLFDDYSTMHRVFDEISSKGHCLTVKALSFLAARGADVIKDSVRELVELLRRVGGSCRGSGIFSLIKLLCSMNAFDLAISVIEETGRISYYNVLIAAKCRNLEFQGARDVFDEMRRIGCDPNTKSYNYLLGSLFKNKRVVEACELLQAMEDLGYLPDSATFEVILVHACKANRMSFAIKFVDQMLSEGSKPSLATHAAFIKGYFCCCLDGIQEFISSGRKTWYDYMNESRSAYRARSVTTHLLCPALPRCTRFAMPLAALSHRALSAIRCVADHLGPEVSRWTLPRSGRHPTYIRLGDTMT
ncbi:hypothetical protein BHE74_00026417 [Ensete ventricosum]|nr:hypothetical protein BHE74_00026417 [Ensete ventricosum]